MALAFVTTYCQDRMTILESRGHLMCTRQVTKLMLNVIFLYRPACSKSEFPQCEAPGLTSLRNHHFQIINSLHYTVATLSLYSANSLPYHHHYRKSHVAPCWKLLHTGHTIFRALPPLHCPKPQRTIWSLRPTTLRCADAKLSSTGATRLLQRRRWNPSLWGHPRR